MHKDFCGWSLESINAGTVETKYIVEYVNDKKIWDKINYIESHYCEIEPRQESYHLYSKRDYDNISDAFTFYMTWFVSDQCYDIKLWEQIYVNGKMILEQIIEPKGNVCNNMRIQIDKNMNERLHIEENRTEQLKKENDVLNAFIKHVHAEDMLKEFLQMEESK